MHECKCRMKDLDSYLNDHLAGSVAALELLAHCAHLYKGIPLGAFFCQMEARCFRLARGREKDLLARCWRWRAMSPAAWDCCLHSKDLSWASSGRDFSGTH